jgi:anthranilate phosphoribosyltransferase
VNGEIFSDLRPMVRKLVSRINLSEDEIRESMNMILAGEASESSIASFLVALRMKGESPKEITSILQAVKRNAIKITPNITGELIDTCGTGGDQIRSFNISTAAALIACAAGCKVAKHGNRSVSGFCGSADFLEFIGMDLDTSPDIICKAIENIGFGFLYATKFHPAMRNVASARDSIGIRTAFNIVGPLSNPCTNLSGQLIGVYEPALLETVAAVMQNSELDELMVVHSYDGFDELSNTCENDIIWVVDKEIKRFRFHPRDVNISVAKPEQLLIHSGQESIRDTLRVIYGLATPQKGDIAALNASAALVIGKIAKDLKEGVEIARGAVKAGSPQKKLSEFIQLCGSKDKLIEAEQEFLLT